MKRLSKVEAQKYWPTLFGQWLSLPEQAGRPHSELHAEAFADWVMSEYPAYASFQSTMGPREDIENWAIGELKQRWAS